MMLLLLFSGRPFPPFGDRLNQCEPEILSTTFPQRHPQACRLQGRGGGTLTPGYPTKQGGARRGGRHPTPAGTFFHEVRFFDLLILILNTVCIRGLYLILVKMLADYFLVPFDHYWSKKEFNAVRAVAKLKSNHQSKLDCLKMLLILSQWLEDLSLTKPLFLIKL